MMDIVHYCDIKKSFNVIYFAAYYNIFCYILTNSLFLMCKKINTFLLYSAVKLILGRRAQSYFLETYLFCLCSTIYTNNFLMWQRKTCRYPKSQARRLSFHPIQFRFGICNVLHKIPSRNYSIF